MISLHDIMSLNKAKPDEVQLREYADDGCALWLRYRLRSHVLRLHVIASWGLGWDHISVSRNGGIPTWEMMEYVKHLLAKPDEVFMQLHVPKKDHVNIHSRTLHMWRPQDGNIPLPPKVFV